MIESIYIYIEYIYIYIIHLIVNLASLMPKKSPKNLWTLKKTAVYHPAMVSAEKIIPSGTMTWWICNFWPSKNGDMGYVGYVTIQNGAFDLSQSVCDQQSCAGVKPNILSRDK